MKSADACFCIPPYFAYSAIRTLRERIPMYMNTLEGYTWFTRNKTFTEVLIQDVSLAVKIIFEVFDDNTAFYVANMLIYVLSFGQLIRQSIAMSYIKNSDFDKLKEIFCVKQSVSPEIPY